MKTVLLHVHDDEGQQSRLNAAIAMARALSGKIQCIQVTPLSSYVVTEPFGGMYMVGALYEALEKQVREDKAMVDARLAEANIPHEWIGFDGGVVPSIVSWSHLSDVIILSRADYARKNVVQPVPIVADVALSARTPVLALPLIQKSFDPRGHAMVAWNGSPEAANALRAALPMLATAESVTLVTADEKETNFPVNVAIDYLSIHGVTANHRHADVQPAVADTLIETAASLSAAYVVMGAYGHSRFREAVLGGVTRSMLEDCPVPLLLAH